MIFGRMSMIDESDEAVWIEQQEKGIRQSIENLQAEIALYERQLAALCAQRTNAGMLSSAHHLTHPRFRGLPRRTPRLAVEGSSPTAMKDAPLSD